MKSLRRSIISSSVMWISYVLFGYFVLIRGVFITGRLDYLVFGNDGKNLLLSIGYCVGLAVFTVNAYNKTFMPCYEMFIRKQVVHKITQITWMSLENNGAFLPWTSMTYLRISNEKGIFSFPDHLPYDVLNHKIRILFLRRAKLVLQVSIVE